MGEALTFGWNIPRAHVVGVGESPRHLLASLAAVTAARGKPTIENSTHDSMRRLRYRYKTRVFTITKRNCVRKKNIRNHQTLKPKRVENMPSPKLGWEHGRRKILGFPKTNNEAKRQKVASCMYVYYSTAAASSSAYDISRHINQGKDRQPYLRPGGKTALSPPPPTSSPRSHT